MIKNLIITITLFLTISSCQEEDNGVIPSDEETALIVGMAHDDLDTVDINTSLPLLTDLSDSVFHYLDLDSDDELDISLFSVRIDANTQLLLLQSNNNVKIPASLGYAFEYLDNAYSYVNLFEQGMKLDKNAINWVTSQKLLLAYRSKNSYLSPYPNPIGNVVYLPISYTNKIGWLEFKISTNEQGIVLESIELKTLNLIASN